ncbi:MAG: clostripain-related cysteine peptidase [Alistipes putredinis]|nr:MAG: clostripain-related cysteine peptidase [Alistipes putredinis]
MTVLSGCSKPEEERSDYLHTDIQFIYSKCEAQSFDGTVTSNVDWSVSGMTDWCSVSLEKGAGDGRTRQISVILTENTKNYSRHTTLYITGGAVTVKIPVSQRGISAKVENVLVMYMIGNNNLSGYLSGNVKQALEAVSKGVLGSDGRILVFSDTGSGSTLSELEYDYEKRAGVCIEIKDYGTVNCTDPLVIAKVMNDIEQEAPASHYAISIGAHGFGWLPGYLGTDRRNRSVNPAAKNWMQAKAHWSCDESSTRNIGPDGSSWMDTSDLAAGLSGLHFDFMMLDVCFMASVEALYDLRGTADYIMASPCEIMAKGFPYGEIVSSMFSDWGGWSSVADCFVDYFASESYFNSAYISVVKTSELDALAQRFSDVVNSGLVSEVDADRVQHYEQLDSHIFYDMEHYVRSMNCTSEPLVEEFLTQLSRTVVYTRSTGRIWSNIYGSRGEWITLQHACGLSSYIPRDIYPVFGQAYRNTAWGRRVYTE